MQSHCLVNSEEEGETSLRQDLRTAPIKRYFNAGA